jgi:hypothetical protein
LIQFVSVTCYLASLLQGISKQASGLIIEELETAGRINLTFYFYLRSLVRDCVSGVAFHERWMEGMIRLELPAGDEQVRIITQAV